jgi:hypothetical protein
MNLIRLLLGALLVFVSFNLNAQTEGIEQFSWMLGNWKVNTDKGEGFESWIQQDEHTLIGKGYYIVKGDTTIYEKLRIQKIENYYTFIPIIGNNYPVLFTLVESGNNKWIFENKEHDFPQRVVYSRKGENSMLAWIEGELNGEQMKEEYLFEKIK